MAALELLAPARDLDTGIAAVSSGADAVYIGAPRFGARAAAGNSISDVERLAAFAHRYRAKVYVTLNTLLFDNELDDARKIAVEAWDAGADALIVQDMAFLEMNLPPIPLFASTQTDNSDPARVAFLEKAGFSRVILARELTLPEIRAVREATTIPLESFIHGALCVSYSGRCWLSYAAGGRSGNRGECAQPCRMTWDLSDAKGRLLAGDRYLLSLRDMRRSGRLADLARAGVTSFKIEGRLKDASYVRNAVAAYRRELDALIGSGEYASASQGRIAPDFEPDVRKTFNRGFTEYFLDGRKGEIASFYTQKSLGEELGTIVEKKDGWFRLDRESDLRSGDGICYFNRDRELNGMQIEHAEEGKIYPHDIRFVEPGMTVYRNHDHAFTKALENSRSVREIPIRMNFRETERGFLLEVSDIEGNTGVSEMNDGKQTARNPSQAAETLRKQLRKLGGTGYCCEEPTVDTRGDYFFPVSALNALRRDAVDMLEGLRRKGYVRKTAKIAPTTHPFPVDEIGFEGNISNRLAERFYRNHGVKKIEPAAETGLPMGGRRVMTTKHCLKREMGLCARHPEPERAYPSPFSIPADGIAEPLLLSDGRHTYRLRFDCAQCRMELYADENA
jgi:putative protease